MFTGSTQLEPSIKHWSSHITRHSKKRKKKIFFFLREWKKLLLTSNQSTLQLFNRVCIFRSKIGMNNSKVISSKSNLRHSKHMTGSPHPPRLLQQELNDHKKFKQKNMITISNAQQRFSWNMKCSTYKFGSVIFISTLHVNLKSQPPKILCRLETKPLMQLSPTDHWKLGIFPFSPHQIYSLLISIPPSCEPFQSMECIRHFYQSKPSHMIQYKIVERKYWAVWLLVFGRRFYFRWEVKIHTKLH